MKIGIFYGSSTGNTETAAELISENFSEHDCTVQDVSSIEPDDLLGYDFLILGISTWYVGEAQDDWIDLLDDMEGMDFNGVSNLSKMVTCNSLIFFIIVACLVL